MKLFALFAGLLFAGAAIAQQARLASDFEIAQMEKQLARSRGFEAQLSGRLNLGDVRAARNELSLARGEYRKAIDLASAERLDARRESSLSRYAVATSYAALAAAKLGRDADAFALLEETARYASDDAGSWNLYASAMRILGHPRKAISAARNSVEIASRAEDALDLAVYRHALATALIESGEAREAEQLLLEVTTALRSSEFASLQREVVRQEAFEVYSSARGDVAAYVSLLNRAQLRLASLYERRGDLDRARAEYRRVLEGRSDDVTALGALARLASGPERERLYADAFEANPFSLPLVREYQRHLQAAETATAIRASAGDATGTQVRAVLSSLSRGERREARTLLESLLTRFPSNDTLRTLEHESEGPATVDLPSQMPSGGELRALLQAFEKLAPAQRVALDQTTFTSTASFAGISSTIDGKSAFESGTIEGVPFLFPAPTVFAGTFDPASPLRLTYRILGVTRAGDADALLLEPVRLETIR
jgi:hypothetical protein